MSKGLGLAVSLALFAAAACTATSRGSAVAYFALTGQMRYSEPRGEMVGQGDDCNAFRSHLPRVLVYDTSNRLLGFSDVDPRSESERPSTHLGPNWRVCRWSFRVADLPRSDAYRVVADGFGDIFVHRQDASRPLIFGSDVN